MLELFYFQAVFVDLFLSCCNESARDRKNLASARALRLPIFWFIYSTMLDQGPPCFGHLAKNPFSGKRDGSSEIYFQDDYMNI